MTDIDVGLVERLQGRLAGMVDDIGDLVCAESPSSDLGAVAASARVVGDVGTRLLGVRPESVVLDGRTHLRWTLGSGPTRVLLLAHHDTVWPLGTLHDRPFTVEDGILRGPGCFDMKSGVVMALYALADLIEMSTRGGPHQPDPLDPLDQPDPLEGVTLLVTGDEEVGSPTSRALIGSEAAGCDAVLVLEAAANGGALKCRRKGVSQYDIQVHGRAAHAGLEPEAGVNATIELAHQVLAVCDVARAAAGTTVTPTVAASGTTGNTVPAAASLHVDCRMWTAAEQERVDRDLRALTPVEPRASIQVTGGPNRPPLPGESSAALFARAGRVAARLDLGRLEGAGVGGASDGNFTAGLGIATLDGLGAVGGGAHALHEHVLVAMLAPRTALLAGLVADLVHRGSPAEPAESGRR